MDDYNYGYKDINSNSRYVQGEHETQKRTRVQFKGEGERRPKHILGNSIRSPVRLVVGIHLELHEDHGIFGDGAESPNKPWHVCNDVILFGAMEEYLGERMSL